MVITPDQLKDLLEEYYINDVPQAALEADTVEEIIQALGDPYTAYMDAEEFAAYEATMSDGALVGIGISALVTDEGLLLVSIYEDSPAEALGLVPGDLIYYVEGGPEEQSPNILTSLLQGEEGTEVTILVRHENGKEQRYTTKRAVITIPATTTTILEDGTTGYIFAGDVENATVEAYNKAADAIQALKQGKIDAVIIDSEPAKVFVQKNDDLTILNDPFAEEEYSIAYKIGNDELGKKIDDALTSLKSDGTLDSIVSHWIGDEADHVPYTPDSSVARNGKLVMATNAEFPPYESMEGGAIVGIDVDMMNAVCDRIGMELEIENMAFDSIIAAVNSGKADVGVAGMSVTPKRQKNVSFTQGYAVSKQVIVVRK